MHIYVRIFALLLIFSGSMACCDTADFNAQKPCILNEIKAIIPQKNTIRYTQVPRGIILSVAQTEIFEDNSSKISPDGKILLKKIAELLKKFENDCTIESHNENSIIKSDTGEQSWETSILQATALADFLTNELGIESSRLFPIGFGEIMPFRDNVAPADFPDNRVDFVIFDYTASR